MNMNEAKKNYEQLFSSAEDKARAFDQIAENYYFMNFGSLSKTDLDVLMFSIFLEKILDKDQTDFSSYSNYRLSKQLGITQTRVNNLKEKKELRYPYEHFDWRESFRRISGKAILENGKIKLYIPDKNLFLEVRNAIEELGGFVEIQLTQNLLQVDLAYFLDLMLAIDDETTRTQQIERIKDTVKKYSKDVEIVNRQPIGKALMGMAPDLLLKIFEECLPILGKLAAPAAKSLFQAITQKGA